MAVDDGPPTTGMVGLEDFVSRSQQLGALGALVQQGILTEAQMRDALAHTFAPRQLAALRALNDLIQHLSEAAFLLTLLKDPGEQVDEELLYGLAVVDQDLNITFHDWVTRHGIGGLPASPGSGFA